MKLWEVSTGKEIRTFTGHSDDVNSVTFSPDGKYALSGSEDETMKLWEVSTGKEIRTFTGHSNRVWSVAFSPDGKYVLSGSLDYTMKLWEVSTAKEIRTFTGHSDAVNSVTFSLDGKYVLSGSNDGTLRIWNIVTREWVSFLANADGLQWLVFDNEGYWDSSPNGGDLVAMVKGMDVWNIDQFAVKNNRPDLI